MLNGEIAPAGLTRYEVAPAWVEKSTKFVFNETTRTVEVRPDLRDKLAQTLRREAAQMQRQLLRRQLLLQLENLLLQASTRCC